HRLDRGRRRRFRRDHGAAAPHAGRGGGAVPSRVDPDAARPRPAAQLPRGSARRRVGLLLPRGRGGGITGLSMMEGHDDEGGSVPITPREALQRAIEHREIFHDEMVDLMRQVMRCEVSPLMTAAILTGLRVKKETVGEITGAARVMREFAQRVAVDPDAHFVDIVGTGGDGANSFNISTASMFVAAAAG